MDQNLNNTEINCDMGIEMATFCLNLKDMFVIELVILILTLLILLKVVERLNKKSLLKRQLSTKKHNNKYLKVKQQIKEQLNIHHVSLKHNVSQIIVNNLRISFSFCNGSNITYEKEIQKIFGIILQPFLDSNDLDEDGLVRVEKALRFCLKDFFILHPLDVQGSRRCFILESILAHCLQDVKTRLTKSNNNEETSNNTHIASSSREDGTISESGEKESILPDFPIECPERETNNKLKDISSDEISLSEVGELNMEEKDTSPSYAYYFSPIMQTLIFSVGLWTLDCLYTDPAMAFLFINMAERVSFMNISSVVNGSLHSAKILEGDSEDHASRLYTLFWTLIPILIAAYLGPLLFALYTNPIKKAIRSLQGSIAMALPHVEEKNIQIDPTVAVTRHHLSIDEAGFESLVQLTYQWGIYFTFINALHELKEETKIPVDIITYFNFSQQILPWLSLAASIFSLTMHQYKSNATQHEYSMAFPQKICLLLCCIFNTLSYTCIFVSFSTNLFDTIFYANVGMFIQVVVIVLSVFLMGGLLQAVRYTQRLFILDGLGSEDRMPVPLSGKRSRAFLITFWKLAFNCNVSALMEMPVSRHKIFFPQQEPVSTTSYITFNSIKSVNVYLGFIRQSVAYILMIFVILFFFCLNTYFFGLDVTITPARLNFHIISMISIPCGQLLAYMFLWLYLKFDRGTLTSCDLRWMNGNTEGQGERNLNRELSRRETMQEMGDCCSYYVCCVTCEVRQDFSFRNHWVQKPLYLKGVWEDLNFIETVDTES